MLAKFGLRPFPRSSVILFTEWQNDHITSAWLAEVIMYAYTMHEADHRPNLTGRAADWDGRRSLRCGVRELRKLKETPIDESWFKRVVLIVGS